MKRLITVVAAAALSVGTAFVSGPAQSASGSTPRTAEPAASAADSAPAPYVPPPISWGACADQTLIRYGAQCGMLTVPLDYAHPRGTLIHLAVSRLRHTTPQSAYQGVMLVNPGGPGGSGLSLAVLQGFVPQNAGKAYDWIGFDPRGVGSSVPALSCDGRYTTYDRPYYVPVTAQIENAWLTRTRGYAKACATAGGPLLDHVKTTDTVRDMESIRIALGQKKINFYGFSYGTYLGQVYATMHPDRVRRFVLDSNVDPRRVWYQANLDQDYAFDRNIGIYFDWVAKHDDVYGLGNDGRTVERTYYRILNQLRAHPQAGGTIGPDEWNDVFVSAAYYVYGWTDIAKAFSAAVNHGDYRGIKSLWDRANPQGPGTDNGYAMYLATECTDAPWPHSWSVWQRDNWRAYDKAPFLTWSNAWFNAPCRTWSGKAAQEPVQVSGRHAPPILLIDETYDAATPYSGSLEVRSLFPRSVLVEGVGGTTHAGSLSGVACTDNTIAAYLATGALPERRPGRRSDKQCDPVPQPNPSAASAAAGGSGASAAGSALRIR
ncbi:alpha/beta hydrolase [Terrabacter lapilli]|uniref:Alpha/beta hydrolase n=1 Tax=Terrabacter lapilli TaxID=436231 RepID=A0ABN2SAQ1_9MICO